MKKVVINLSFLLAMYFVSVDLIAQDLYLIIGQSNASGRDTNIDANGLDAPTSDVKYFTDNNQFINASQPLNEFSSLRKDLSIQGVNFGLEFGKRMKTLLGNDVYLVVNARGGTKVAQWKEGNSKGYFASTVARVKAAEVACSCNLKGILWHQGEGNVQSSAGTYTSSYFNSLKDLIVDFRNEFGNVPFLAGQLLKISSNNSFNNALKTIDDSSFGHSDVDWVTAKNLTSYDGTHFDAASTRKLGVRYAKIMKPYVQGSSTRMSNLEEVTEIAKISVYPNPANTSIQVLGANDDEIVRIYNLLGMEVIQTTSKNIEISQLESGIYYLQVGTNKSIKFVKDNNN